MNKSKKLDQLVSQVDAIFAQFPDDPDSEIAALRDRVDNAILETWTAVASESAESRATAEELMKSLNDYIRKHSWVVLTAAVVLGVSFSFLAGRLIHAYAYGLPRREVAARRGDGRSRRYRVSRRTREGTKFGK